MGKGETNSVSSELPGEKKDDSGNCIRRRFGAGIDFVLYQKVDKQGHMF